MREKLMDDARNASRVLDRHTGGQIVAKSELLAAVEQLNQAARGLAVLDSIESRELLSFGDEEINLVLASLPRF